MQTLIVVNSDFLHVFALQSSYCEQQTAFLFSIMYSTQSVHCVCPQHLGLRYTKMSLMAWVVVIPKEGLIRLFESFFFFSKSQCFTKRSMDVHARTSFFWWYRLSTLSMGTFLLNAANLGIHAKTLKETCLVTWMIYMDNVVLYILEEPIQPNFSVFFLGIWLHINNVLYMTQAWHFTSGDLSFVLDNIIFNIPPKASHQLNCSYWY